MTVKTIDLYEYFGVERQGGGGELTVYARSQSVELEEKRRPAILILPGGGYDMLSDREGEPIAVRFTAAGYQAFVLAYSVKTAYPVPLVEACLAMSYIKRNAEKYGIDGAHVAVIGFSAGGHLAGLLATADVSEINGICGDKFDFTLPDAAILSYPVASMRDGLTHEGTRGNITGGDKRLYERLSTENRIDKNSPPMFIWHTAADDCVAAENSLLLATACKKAGVPFSLHVFEKGGHGLSLCNAETDNRTARDIALDGVGKWVELALDWLAMHGFSVKNGNGRR